VVSVGDAAAALIENERFSFAVEWEGSGFGTEDVLTSEGHVDLAGDRARYAPLIDPSGQGAVRIAGDDLYVGTEGGPWQHSRRLPDQPSWMELMPLSGGPALLLDELTAVEDEDEPTDVPGHTYLHCRRFTSPGGERGPERPFVACHDDAGVLRWIAVTPAEGDERIAARFDDIGAEFEVVRPTDDMTEFPVTPEELDPLLEPDASEE
jgi:hypothetical protein